MTIDLARLRELAWKATPGPWDAWDRGIGYELHTYGVELNRAQKGTFYQRDAEYIAAINPFVIRALLDRLEAAERVVKAYRKFDEVRHLPAGRNDEEYVLSWEAADEALAAYDREVGKE